MPALFADHALSCRIEAGEAASIEGVARVAARRLPDLGAAVLSIAGGRAGFVGPTARLSRAAGMGMSGPVSREDVEALEAFYFSRGADARVLVSPFAHPSLVEHLAERGFRLVELDNVLVRRLGPGDRGAASHDGVSIRHAALADAAAWVLTSLTGFAPPGSSPALDRAPVFEAGFDDPANTFLTGVVDGVAAGGAALRVIGPTAYFFAASTVPAFRGRGVQGALIAARLTLAAEAGCDLAYTVTSAGSGSQRNFERAGFSPAYSQALLVKPYSTRTIS